MKFSAISPRQLRQTLSALLLALCAVSPSLWATTPGDSLATQLQESTESTAAPADSLGRDTPRGAFEGYIKAVAREDYQGAAEYLDLGSLAAGERVRGERVARILQQALDRDGSVPPAVLLSDKPEGQLDDGQAPELERVGSLRIGDTKVALLLERVERWEQSLWLVSAQTLNQLPARITDESSLFINQLIPDSLIEHKWNGVPWGHWIGMLLLAVMAYLFSRVVVTAVAGFVRMLLLRRFGDYPTGLVKAFAGPVQLFMAVLLFVTAAQRAGISIIVRQNFSEAVVIVAWLSVLWLIWRLIDVTAAVGEKRMTDQARFGALSGVLLLRRGSRLLLVVAGVIVALHTAGVNVTTGLAALGIGGIVIALGAQKVVENLVGSATLVFDQPVRIGDFCKAGETLGTVERIGMRSTRIRTLERTLVTIPNGDFSARTIENYSHRDRFLFRPTLNLHYHTSPEQIRHLLVQLRGLLDAHPQVDPDPARVRFLGFGTNSLNVEVFAYILAADYEDFLAVQETLNLRIAELVTECGTGFAFDSQMVHVEQTPVAPSALRAGGPAEPEAPVPAREWREAGDFQLPTTTLKPKATNPI